ncbi:MAG: hypothetical protein LBI20_01315 [Holosporales bacterium]|jgi:hypothetical protein|nr:hypothetical protein [Holosporales bacterium]
MSRKRIRSPYAATKIWAGVILAFFISQNNAATAAEAAVPNPLDGNRVELYTGVEVSNPSERPDGRVGAIPIKITSSGDVIMFLTPGQRVFFYGPRLSVTFLNRTECPGPWLCECLAGIFPPVVIVGANETPVPVRTEFFPVLSDLFETGSGVVVPITERLVGNAGGQIWYRFLPGDRIFSSSGGHSMVSEEATVFPEHQMARSINRKLAMNTASLQQRPHIPVVSQFGDPVADPEDPWEDAGPQ